MTVKFNIIPELNQSQVKQSFENRVLQSWLARTVRWPQRDWPGTKTKKEAEPSFFSPKNSFQFHSAKFENFKTEKFSDKKKVSQLHKDKVCWSEAILCFWSSNQMTVKSNKIPELNQSQVKQTFENRVLHSWLARTVRWPQRDWPGTETSKTFPFFTLHSQSAAILK